MAAFPLKSNSYIRLTEACNTIARCFHQHTKHKGLKYQREDFRKYKKNCAGSFCGSIGSEKLSIILTIEY